MDGSRFDRLTKALGTSRPRRRILGALLAGLLVGPRLSTVGAEDEGVVIADASGGDNNVGGRVTPDRQPDPEPRPEPPCRPELPAALCQGRCNRVVADGCGGRVRCTCAAGEVCGPGDRCCPEARLCLASGVCCADGSVCAPGGGVCCAPDRVCAVGGVADACCPEGGTCLSGICVSPA